MLDRAFPCFTFCFVLVLVFSIKENVRYQTIEENGQCQSLAIICAHSLRDTHKHTCTFTPHTHTSYLYIVMHVTFVKKIYVTKFSYCSKNFFMIILLSFVMAIPSLQSFYILKDWKKNSRPLDDRLQVRLMSGMLNKRWCRCKPAISFLSLNDN